MNQQSLRPQPSSREEEQAACGRTEWLVRGGIVGLGALFIYAGVVKLADPAAFVGQVGAYQILPAAIAEAVGRALPWFETLLGLCLVLNIKARSALFGSVGLLFIFLVALLSLKLRGIEIACGCFGEDAPGDLWMALGRDLVLLGVASALYLRLLIRGASNEPKSAI